MNRNVRRGGIVVVVVLALVYWLLMQVGIVLAIPPALAGLALLVSILSDPVVLTGVLLLVGTTAVWVWYRVDDVGTAVVEGLAWCKERLGFKSPVVVRGSLEHGGARWIGHHTRDGTTSVEHRACPDCAVELVQKAIPHTDLVRPNTPITADETTREREAQAWENVFGREKTDPEELTEALVCPHDACRFSIAGEKHLMSGKSAVTKQFSEHFRRMRTGGSDPFGPWQQRAAERLTDLEPTPADLWDVYARECDDDAVMVNRAFGHGLTGEDTSVTCDALEKHKLDAEGVDQLIEFAPDGFDTILAWLVRSEYLEQRREITRKMNAEGEKCRKELQHIEQQFGSIAQQVLADRYDRTEPQIDLETAKHHLDAANEAVRTLRTDLDFDYLPSEHRRRLSSIKNGVANAVEYVAQLRAFENHRQTIDPTIDAFEERFEPYVEGENYMITPDEEYLKQGCSTICHQLTDLHSRVRLELLPPEMTEWAHAKKDEFTEHSRRLPTYNTEFVERERERYANLFKTEHGPFNEEQQKAIVRNDLHNLVDASAGTGKTLTLTYRFLYLYRRGVPLNDIVAVTFTNDAADEMKERIADKLDGVDQTQLNISTYHSFAKDIVEDSISGPVNTDLGDAHERYVEGFLDGDDELEQRHENAMTEFKKRHSEFLQVEDEYIDNHRKASQSRREYLCEQYAEFLETARNFDQTPADIRERLSPVQLLQHRFGQAACEILGAFLDHAEGTDEPVDFLDMVKSATRLGKAAPDHFSQEYQHILFDEFQDADGPVLEFVRMFLGGSGDTRLFAVGDDWQSIYGFRGSDPRYFIEFDERFEGIADTQLAINYRCPPAIVEAGAELMANSEDKQNEKDVKAFSESRVVPQVHKLGGIVESRIPVYVVTLIEDALSETEPKDVMVLTRNAEKSNFRDPIRSLLDERGIPWGKEGVQTQSIHSSKGTEAEHVIVVNAKDDIYDGMPQPNKENELITPASANPATHYAEERRLFYVALTRTEHRLDVITHHGYESRYFKEISSFFEEKRSDLWTADGVVGDWDYSGMPITAQFACDGFSVELTTKTETFTRKLEPGQRYRLSNIDPENNGWGTKIKLDESVEIEKLDVR